MPFILGVSVRFLTTSSDLHLKSIPPGLLRPLQQLTKLPPVEPPITEDVYSSLQPFLCLFLSGNSLTALSSELFELSALQVLSVRNNKLTEIPPAIRRLTSLQTANCATNRLQYLPWDLLWLIQHGELKHMTVRPNPLLKITESEIAQWHYPKPNQPSAPPLPLKMHSYTGPSPSEAWAPIHVATGPVQRFNMEGQPLIRGKLSNTEMSSRAPSLREVALLALTKSPTFDYISDTDEDLDFCPPLVARLLRQAREVKNAGGRVCSVCGRSFVIARSEWIEWWDCSVHENGFKGPRDPGAALRPLPFKRLGCSWGCVPDESGRTRSS